MGIWDMNPIPLRLLLSYVLFFIWYILFNLVSLVLGAPLPAYN